MTALCALARDGHKVRDVHQASDGCMPICEIPSDMFSLAGQLLVTIHREPEGASVHADTRIVKGNFSIGARATPASTGCSTGLGREPDWCTAAREKCISTARCQFPGRSGNTR